MNDIDPRPGLIWFRRDLRLGDNPAWAAARTRHRSVVALFVLDDTLLAAAGPFRRRQLLAEVHALDASLRRLGGRLLVRRGDAAVVVPATVAATGAGAVYANDDVTPYARRRDDAVRAALGAVPWRSWWGGLVHAPGAVLTGKGTLSQVFTPFHKTWAATEWGRWPTETDGAVLAAVADDGGDEAPRPDAAPPYEPGEDAALGRLQRWAEQVDDYLATRDLPGIDGTSVLSGDLRFGTLSPRTVATILGTASPGRAGFVRQLAWRDWYAHLTHERPDLPTAPVRPAYAGIGWRNDPDEIAAWKAGRTGYPIVDAGMRQLAATGWMHNRVRMIVASFLVKDLLVDWRIGERWFRHLLVDGDVAQNAGNWQWVAGTGLDAAPYFRVFNPTSQGRKFDPTGAYVRRWVPELAGLADRDVHEPWLAGPLALAAAGYPEPMVDHPAARDRCLAAYQAATGATGGGAERGHDTPE